MFAEDTASSNEVTVNITFPPLIYILLNSISINNDRKTLQSKNVASESDFLLGLDLYERNHMLWVERDPSVLTSQLRIAAASRSADF